MAVDFLILNLNEFNESEYGDDIESIISDFTCPKNLDAQKFLHKMLLNLQRKSNQLHILSSLPMTVACLGIFHLL